MQDCSFSIANALKAPQSCTKPSILSFKSRNDYNLMSLLFSRSGSPDSAVVSSVSLPLLLLWPLDDAVDLAPGSLPGHHRAAPAPHRVHRGRPWMRTSYVTSADQCLPRSATRGRGSGLRLARDTLPGFARTPKGLTTRRRWGPR